MRELSIVEQAASVWSNSELIMKVKEPIAEEYAYFRPGLILFTYLHLAADATLTKKLKESGMIAIAYETVSVNQALPLLTPMSEVAGRMATTAALNFLKKRKVVKAFS